VCGTVFTQIVPPADDEAVRLYVEFERSVYGMLRGRRAGQAQI
jgi:hypothetical protein